MSKTLRNYWNNEKRRRRASRLRNMARTLHRRNNNANVRSNNWPNNHKNRTRRAGWNSGNRNSMNFMRLNNWGNTPKSNE